MIEVFADQNARVNAAQQVGLGGRCQNDQKRHHQTVPPCLYILGADFARTAFPDHQPDGRVVQAKAFTDLVDEVPLIAEVEEVLCVDEGHERRRTGGSLGQVEDLQAAALVAGGCIRAVARASISFSTPVGTRAPFWLSTSRMSCISLLTL